jgi:hypothetical protein
VNNKIITYSLIGIVVAFFILYFTAINVMLDSNDNPGKTIASVKASVKSDDWEQANQQVNKVRHSWNNIQYLIMLNFAAEDFNTFEEKLEDMNTALEQRDKDQLLLAANQALYYWQNMVRLIPKP